MHKDNDESSEHKDSRRKSSRGEYLDSLRKLESEKAKKMKMEEKEARVSA